MRRRSTAKTGESLLEPARHVRTAPRNTHQTFAEVPALEVHGIGNQAVQRLLYGGRIQAKLRVSRPGDPLEQEADRTAEQMVNAPVALDVRGFMPSVEDSLLRKEVGEEEDEGLVLLKNAGNLIPEVPPDIQENLHSLRDSGKPLPKQVRAFFEPRFGRDLSHVRVHTNDASAKMAAAIHARAFTMDKDVVFAAGEYAPETHAGRILLAHELTHTFQQGNSGGAKPGILRQAAIPTAQQPGTNGDPVQAEWNAHPSIHAHFHSGLTSYRDLRPLYVARGITNPAAYLDTNITQVSFFGRSTPAHLDMAAPLAAAETALTTQGVTPQINSFWAFVPRRIGGMNALSNHSLGKAVDINPSTNPFVKDRDEIRVIKAVTGVDLGSKPTDAEMQKASQDFQGTFNQAWIDRKKKELANARSLIALATLSDSMASSPSGKVIDLVKNAPLPPISDEDLGQVAERGPRDVVKLLPKGYVSELESTLKSIDKKRRALDQYAQAGFLNLEQSLITALTDAGFSWGGRWARKKDFMHFELPNA